MFQMLGLGWVIGKSFWNCTCRVWEWKKLANISSTPENSSSGILVRLYLREEDNRARILCKWRSRHGGTRYSTLPLNTLDIYREGPALLLCRRIFDSYK